jgi:hypothetical protein
LNKESLEIEDTVFIGCTLWSHIPIEDKDRYEYYVNDYKRININKTDYFTVEYQNELNKEHVNWLNDELKKNKNKKIIVLTHHVKNEIK